jgi:type II restriction enzyme
MSEKKGNLGNWSELYALAYIVVHRGAHGPVPKDPLVARKFFKVLEIFLSELNPNAEIQYVLTEESVKVYRNALAETDLDLQLINEALDQLATDLKSDGATRHFSIGSGQQLLTLLGKKDIGASSSQKISDFELVISDPQTGNPSPRIGYSVKSSIGSPATLLNASGSTNFTYEITHPKELNPTEALEGDSLKGHLRQLIDAGFVLRFDSMQSEVFRDNLMRVDSLMPELVSKLLVASLTGKSSTFADVVEGVFASDDSLSSQRVFKMKQLLGSIAMGLRPGNSWDGDPTKFKGIIVVDSVGNVIFNYQFNQIEFWDYLYSSTKFEIPSRTRHGFGRIYKEQDKYFIKLNLQLRFIN